MPAAAGRSAGFPSLSSARSSAITVGEARFQAEFSGTQISPVSRSTDNHFDGHLVVSVMATDSGASGTHRPLLNVRRDCDRIQCWWPVRSMSPAAAASFIMRSASASAKGWLRGRVIG